MKSLKKRSFHASLSSMPGKPSDSMDANNSSV
jgi:hypothetical protein